MISLPIELIELIVSFVPHTSLRTFSSVCRLFRYLCRSLLFQSVQIGHTQAQLEGLLQISKSSYASNVRALRYEANSLVDPCKQRYLETSQGLLLLSLPHLPNLHTLEISLTNDLKDQFGHASVYMPSGKDCYLSHLEKLLTAAVAARRNGIIIRSLYISGFYHQAAIEDCFLQALALNALSSIEELRVISTSPMLPLLERLHLLRLQRVELIDVWLSLSTLEGLLRNSKGLRSLYLEDIWLVDELVGSSGEFGLSKGLVVSIVGVLERLDRPLDVTLKYCEKTCHFSCS
ncbi:F-box protein [Aspergillus stella-maris]|uniref:F-box protein n=1 Tax=Aspergillus stella-maris TaxID=1810926 RepID=UPI003CCD20D8